MRALPSVEPVEASVDGFFLRVNICSIRSVTTKPPTMLTAASTIATSPTTTRAGAVGLCRSR